VRGARKNNGKYIFIPPKNEAEGNERREDAIDRLRQVKFELTTLEKERRELVEEIEAMNKFLRGDHEAQAAL
jgi:hypothetical protein